MLELANSGSPMALSDLRTSLLCKQKTPGKVVDNNIVTIII